MDPDFLRDLFAPFRPVAIRRMFSGAGLFVDGLMFGLVVREAIYLKVDAASIPEFEREGCKPFTYLRGRKSGRPTEHALPYWSLPERLYDDPDELAVWAARAFAVAQQKKLALQKKSAPRAKAKRKRTSRRSKARSVTPPRSPRSRAKSRGRKASRPRPR
jgi:DNA transformation protein and related proteins